MSVNKYIRGGFCKCSFCCTLSSTIFEWYYNEILFPSKPDEDGQIALQPTNDDYFSTQFTYQSDFFIKLQASISQFLNNVSNSTVIQLYDNNQCYCCHSTLYILLELIERSVR